MKVFVSYNNRDGEVAGRIVDGLAASQTNFDPYFAPRSNIGGAYWLPQLGEELERSDCCFSAAGSGLGRSLNTTKRSL